MSTFVLLHGAFHGAWCWARVTPLLRAAGHTVFTPTQTGLGERAPEIHAGITIDDFADDLVAVLEAEDLHDAVLVGHSFGGYAITGAADRVPERIRHLVFLDGSIPVPGKASLDLSPPDVAAARRRSAAETGGIGIAPPDPAVFGVPPGPDADWLRQSMTPHPFNTMNTVLTLTHEPGNGLPRTYVACTDPVYGPLAYAQALVREQPNWQWREIATGHDCMVTAPEATAALLMEIAP